MRISRVCCKRRGRRLRRCRLYNLRFPTAFLLLSYCFPTAFLLLIAPAAMQALHTAIGLSPVHAALYQELASVYKAVGQEQLAKRVLRTSLRLEPLHAGSHYQLGEILAGTTDV